MADLHTASSSMRWIQQAVNSQKHELSIPYVLLVINLEKNRIGQRGNEPCRKHYTNYMYYMPLSMRNSALVSVLIITWRQRQAIAFTRCRGCVRNAHESIVRAALVIFKTRASSAARKILQFEGKDQKLLHESSIKRYANPAAWMSSCKEAQMSFSPLAARDGWCQTW